MANKDPKKPNISKNEKKIVKNSMFLQTSHHVIFILLLILISFLFIAFNEQIRESGQQVASYFQGISQAKLAENYKEQINQKVTDYFSQRNILEMSEQDTINSKNNLNNQFIQELYNLKVTNDLRDFHLDLILVFTQIKLADQEANADLYIQAQSSLQSLASSNSWFIYQ